MGSLKQNSTGYEEFHALWEFLSHCTPYSMHVKTALFIGIASKPILNSSYVENAITLSWLSYKAMNEIGWKDIWMEGCSHLCIFSPTAALTKNHYRQNQRGVVGSEENNANTKKDLREMRKGQMRTKL